jgi:endonuclease/exonuclease/phosphatase family metal-dependent hydrolase
MSTSSRKRKWLAVALGAVGAGALGFGLVRTLFFFPPERMQVPVSCRADAAPLPTDRPITVLVWNIQFGAGRGQGFFYDYGDAVSVPAEVVQETLRGIAAVIRDVDPDVVLLQEVDRNSRRTARIDQHAWLVEETGYPCHASTPYFRAAYVPHPPQEHLGRMDMHLSVLSRYRIDDVVRYQLPLLQESPVRRLFNLKRALLEVRVPVADGAPLVLFNTHLSAFARGDGTVDRQVAMVGEHLARVEAERSPWLIGGDFNALAPGDDPKRFDPQERALYPEAVTPVQPLLDRYGDPVGVDRWRDQPEAWRTFVRYGQDVPDRTLDYVFHGTQVRPVAHRVLQEHNTLSDHLPLVFTFQIGL